jgi:hypothetical protein
MTFWVDTYIHSAGAAASHLVVVCFQLLDWAEAARGFPTAFTLPLCPFLFFAFFLRTCRHRVSRLADVHGTNPKLSEAPIRK